MFLPGPLQNGSQRVMKCQAWWWSGLGSVDLKGPSIKHPNDNLAAWSSSCAMHSGNALMTFHPLPMVVMMPASHEASWSWYFFGWASSSWMSSFLQCWFLKTLGMSMVLCGYRIGCKVSGVYRTLFPKLPLLPPYLAQKLGNVAGWVVLFPRRFLFWGKGSGNMKKRRGKRNSDREQSRVSKILLGLPWNSIYNQLTQPKGIYGPYLSDKELWSLRFMVWQSHYWILGCSADFFPANLKWPMFGWHLWTFRIVHFAPR